MRILTLLLFASVLMIVNAQQKEARVVCYYASWSVYYQKTKFGPNDINPFLCTHLIYAFGSFLNESGLTFFDEAEDITNGGYLRFTGLKTYNKDLKTLLSIGGWNEGSRRFSSISEDQEKRETLAKNTVMFLRQHNFDGLDINWNFPAMRDGSKPEDKENFASLVKVLREEFEKDATSTGRSRLLLSVAVPHDASNIDNGFDVPELSKYVDWLNVLALEYHLPFETTVNHNSPLYARKNSIVTNKNVNFTVNYYLEAGADPQKLVLGIPVFGRSFTLANTEFTSIGSPAEGPGKPGESTRQRGNLAYFEICKNLMDGEGSSTSNLEDEYGDELESWTVDISESDVMGPHAFKGNQWVGYDDMSIVKKKAEYAADKSLGGILIWTIDQDDFLGRCHGKKFPLVEAAKTALYKRLGLNLAESTPVREIEKSDEKETTVNNLGRNKPEVFTVKDTPSILEIPSAGSNQKDLVVKNAASSPSDSDSDPSKNLILLITSKYDKIVIKKAKDPSVLNIQIKQ